jgi:hypothetical protein
VVAHDRQSGHHEVGPAEQVVLDRSCARQTSPSPFPPAPGC